MEVFADKLKELRAEKKLTQKELAQLLSVTIPTLSHWECGYQEPSYSDLILISNFFNVSTDYLLGRTDELGTVNVPAMSPVLSYDDKKLLDAYHCLEPKLRALLWDMIETWQKNSASLSETDQKKGIGVF